MARIVSLGRSPLMSRGLMPALQLCGHTTGFFPHRSWHRLEQPRGLECLRGDLEASRPDILLFSGFAPPYFRALGDLCHEKGIGLAYWAIEDPLVFEGTLPLALAADHVFTTAVECVPAYERAGIRAQVLTFAVNPAYHTSGAPRPDLQADLALPASFYSWPARIRGYEIMMTAARLSGRPLQVWGAGWEGEQGRAWLGDHRKLGGYLPNSQLGDLCASAAIVLGVQSCDTSVTQTSMRTYEILGCGGFHLTQWTPATDAIFANGRHLVTARTAGEALEMIEYYLAHPEARGRIARLGQQYVRDHHTYLHRVREIVIPALKLQ